MTCFSTLSEAEGTRSSRISSVHLPHQQSFRLYRPRIGQVRAALRPIVCSVGFARDSRRRQRQQGAGPLDRFRLAARDSPCDVWSLRLQGSGVRNSPTVCWSDSSVARCLSSQSVSSEVTNEATRNATVTGAQRISGDVCDRRCTLDPHSPTCAMRGTVCTCRAQRRAKDMANPSGSRQLRVGRGSRPEPTAGSRRKLSPSTSAGEPIVEASAGRLRALALE